MIEAIIKEIQSDENGGAQHPAVSAIIPSLDDSRTANIEALKSDLMAQTLKPIEIIIVRGIRPNGKARNLGAEKASGKFLIFIDDDARLESKDLIAKLIEPLIQDKSIGIVGPSQLIPTNSNRFQILASNQIPRSVFPLQETIVDSDMANHLCLAISAELYKELGGENENIVSGTDPDLRHRVRLSGRRVCIASNCAAYHSMPENLPALLRSAYAKGRNSAIVRRKFPDLIYELDTGFRKDFPPKRPLHYRILRSSKTLLSSLLTFKFILFAYTVSYICGNIAASILPENSKHLRT